MTKLIKPKTRFKDLPEKGQKFIYLLVSKFIDGDGQLRKKLSGVFKKIGREKAEELIVQLIDKGFIKIIKTNKDYIFKTYDEKARKYI